MKIIKEGNLERLKEYRTFECKLCGCVFMAERGEYKYRFDQREGDEWYEVVCPTCKRNVLLKAGR